MRAASLYVRYVSASVRSQMQYRASFVFQLVGQFLAVAVEFVGLWALFDRFGNLAGWTIAEGAMFFGVVNAAFAVAEALGRGFDLFSVLVRSGEFDRMLVRPRSTVLQLFAYEFSLKKVGRLAVGAAAAAWGAVHIQRALPALHWLLLLWAAVGGVALFVALFVLQATMCFWTIESLEMMNILTYGGVETAQYPLGVYRRAFRNLFTYVVPLGCISYFPVATALEKTAWPTVVGWAAPAAGFAFLAAAAAMWRVGVRHYASTGS